ncbi:MAG: hypothetical protein MUO31_00945 [Thermodesulfovibrionales bacterium]|nr:hypothetical protein [Thermodesulfovibrionales bacterium]
MSEPNPKIELDKSGLELPPPTVEKPRDEKGKFQPTTIQKISPEPPLEPVKKPIGEKKDPLLDQIEADYWKSLKGKVDPKELEGLDQQQRIKMLLILSNTTIIKKSKEALDPTQAPPPTPEVHIPTLLERNKASEFRADIRNKTSYLDIADKLRGKK